MESKAYPEMENKGSKICWSKIEKADNGWVVEWTEKKKKEGGGHFEDMVHVEHKKVFGKEEKDAAWETFKEYKMQELENNEDRY